MTHLFQRSLPIVVIGLLPFIASKSRAAEIPTPSDIVPLLGQGYNTEKQSFEGTCLSGVTVNHGRPEASVEYSSTIAEESLADELGVSIGGKARFGVVKVGASASFYKASRSDSFSIAAIYTGSYKFRNTILTKPDLIDKAVAVKDHPDRFREFCGDEFVVQQTLGAKLFFSIRIDFLSKEEKDAFSASFSLSAPLYSAAASLKKATEGLSKRTKINVNVLQIGGKVDKLTNIFVGGAGGGANPSQAFHFVQCSAGDFVKCQQVLANAIDYATNTSTGFPSQISPDLLDPTRDGGPAVLTSVTRSYKTAGIFVDVSPEMDRQMKLARGRISESYEKGLGQYLRANRITNDGVIRLSERQSRRFTEMKAKLFLALNTIVEAGMQCFERPKSCPQEFASIDPDQPHGVKLYDSDKDFVVQPEVFVQYCDLGTSPQSEQGLAKSVRVLVNAARKIEPEPFQPAFEGDRVDDCNVASMVLGRQTELSLNETGIKDLRPLGSLTKLTSLILRRNGIQDLSSLATLVNLEYLDLNDNLVTSVEALLPLINLKRLVLSDNRLEDVTLLARLGSIEQLDLRNNEIGIKCPFEDASRCMTADFRHNNAFVAIGKNTTAPRMMHAAVALDSGDVLVVGGYELGNTRDSRSEVFDVEQGRFRNVGALSKHRAAHTATRLEDGRVLVAGGWGALKSGELYDPASESFRPAKNDMATGRTSHTATLLPDGRVLLTGGWYGAASFWTGQDATPTVEVFEPKNGFFYAVGSLEVPRAAHASTLLKDGRVLVTGGYTASGGLASAEIFDPATNIWVKVDDRMKRPRASHAATLLADGKVLISGGFANDVAVDRSEIFDPKTLTFAELPTRMTEARGEHQAVLLADGKVMLIGGRVSAKAVASNMTVCDSCSDTAEIFDPVSRVFTAVSSKMGQRRSLHTVTALPGLRLLVLGGLGADAAYSADLFEYSNLR